MQKGSWIAHLNGLPKTHKEKLAMCPILSATGTYNYKLAKWLDEKVKPLSSNDHTVGDMFSFADDLHEMEINDHDILLSYDVSALLLNKCACRQNNRNPCGQTIFYGCVATHT